MEIRISWERLKWRIDNHWLIYQYELLDGIYSVWAQDGLVVFSTTLSGSEVTEFEADYKDYANASVDKREAETGIIKTKPRPVEGTLALAFIYFTTGDAESLDQDDETIWSINTSTPGVTKVRVTPPYGYYIDGGGIKLLSGVPTVPAKCRMVLAPSIPAQYGGNVQFVKNKHLFAAGDTFVMDVPPKYVKYYPESPYANEAELVVAHGISDALHMEFFVKVYK